MSDSVRRLILGPQRPRVYLGRAMRDFGLDGDPIGVVSAGWQAAEGDIDVLRNDVDRPMNDLGLYARTAQLFADDPELHAAYRQRQERLAERQRMYALRLKHLKVAVRDTLRAEGPASVVAPERRHAISQLRALDRHHQRQIDNTHLRFDSEFNVDTRSALADHAAALHEQLAAMQTVIITGGNLLVTLNRLRLFGLQDVLAGKHLVAWSAGAMLLGEHIVLFHDRLPQGRRDAEVIDKGFGFLNKTVVLPDAKNRLRTGVPLRMSAFSRRFAPARCLLLNNQSAALFTGDQLTGCEALTYPTPNGNIKSVVIK
jgi:hypothetical protein